MALGTTIHVSEHIHLLQTTVDMTQNLAFTCLSDMMANHHCAYSELRVVEWDLLQLISAARNIESGNFESTGILMQQRFPLTC